MIPKQIYESLERLCQGIKRDRLQKAGDALSHRYRTRQNQNETFIQTDEEALAYLCTRLPATFASSYEIFEKLSNEVGINPRSLCDIGAGPCTAFLAAREIFSALEQCSFIEKDTRLLKLGKQIITDLGCTQKTNFQSGDFTKQKDYPKAELVIFSYSLGEVGSSFFESILEKALAACERYLVVIEPGTPYGFERILKAREFFLEKNLNILAPCPHSRACPMPASKWCHFSTRLPRTALHKFIKGGELGYEDEKYSYIAVSKEKREGFKGRIVGRPEKKSGFMTFEVCDEKGELTFQKILKRDREDFSEIRKLEWGDVIK